MAFWWTHCSDNRLHGQKFWFQRVAMGSKRTFFVRPARCQKKCSVKNQDVGVGTVPQPHDTRSALKGETNATTVQPQLYSHNVFYIFYWWIRLPVRATRSWSFLCLELTGTCLAQLRAVILRRDFRKQNFLNIYQAAIKLD